MNTKPLRLTLALLSLFILPLFLSTPSFAGQYKNFDVAIYIPVRVVQRFENPEILSSEWNRIRSQLKVDKVYIEVQRDRDLAGDELIEKVKKFFLEKGVRIAGGMTASDGDGRQFRSFCYTNPDDRKFLQNAVELAARHFDEIIQDDFFFVTTKYDSDIAAKGNRTWTQYRLELMREATENLLIKPAKAINPKVKMVIKYPNWYEHFQGLGFDLEKQARMFDGIYTGTESRDPEMTDQCLQEYESYLIFRYFENIRPGANGGGWVDTFSIRFVDRYAEQLWDTVFAKAPEMMLFEWSGLTKQALSGQRSKWQDLDTSFNYNKMLASMKTKVKDPNLAAHPTYAGIAGYSLEQADVFLGQLGKPVGIKSYKPYHSWGEEFLHNYFGNLGIPIDLQPTFPKDANLVLLTECAASDPDIVAKIKGQLTAGKSVVITSGLLAALQGKGIEEILEVQYTNRKVIANQYLGGFGAGSGSALGGPENPEILFPDIRFLTNDSWPVIRAIASGRGYPLMLMNRYSKGILYIWVMPDNFNDLYRLPTSVTSAFKDYIMAGFPVRLDGPGRAALFAYDNNTFIVQSYRDDETDMTISLAPEFTTIKNIVSGEELKGRLQSQGPRQSRRDTGAQRMTFNVHLLPHSYAVFTAQKDK